MDAIPASVLQADDELIGALEVRQQRRRVRASSSPSHSDGVRRPRMDARRRNERMSLSSESMSSEIRYSATNRCPPPKSRTAAQGSARRRSQSVASTSAAGHPSVRACSSSTSSSPRPIPPRSTSSSRASATVNASSSARSSASDPPARSRARPSAGSMRVIMTTRAFSGRCSMASRAMRGTRWLSRSARRRGRARVRPRGL